MSILFLDKTHSWQEETLLEFLEENPLPKDWAFLTENIEKISNVIQEKTKKGIKVYPSPNRVFRAFYATPLEKVRLVILGMDPYHDGNAVGLCFSVPPGGKINPSLRNIYKEIGTEGNGDLSHWAKQGCLMLNASLTVEKGLPGSHSEYWADFTKKLVLFLAERKPLSWLLMGADALYYADTIKKYKHKIYVTSHPSPFSAYKPLRSWPAFIGSKIFAKINDEIDGEKIVW